MQLILYKITHFLKGLKLLVLRDAGGVTEYVTVVNIGKGGGKKGQFLRLNELLKKDSILQVVFNNKNIVFGKNHNAIC